MKETVWNTLATLHEYTGLGDWFSSDLNQVVMFHAVGTPGGVGNVSVDRMREILAYLDTQYEIVDLPAVYEPSERKRVALTFDDATKDFYTNALPALKEFDAPATLFTVADAVDNECDRLSDNVTASMTMDHPKLQEVADGPLVTIGNHTRTHPKLSTFLTRTDLEREIHGGRERLEERFDTEIDRFAYPYGDFNQTVVDVVRDSHEFAVAGGLQKLSYRRDRYLHPRIAAQIPHREFAWEVSDLSWRLKTAGQNTGLIRDETQLRLEGR